MMNTTPKEKTMTSPTFQELRDGQTYRLTRTGETITVLGPFIPGAAIHIKRADGTYEYTSTRQIEKI